MNLTAAVEEEIWSPPALQNRRRVEASSPALQLPRCSLRVPASAIATKLLQLLPPPLLANTHHLLNLLTIYFLPATVLGVTRVTGDTHAFYLPRRVCHLLFTEALPPGTYLPVYYPKHCVQCHLVFLVTQCYIFLPFV